MRVASGKRRSPSLPPVPIAWLQWTARLPPAIRSGPYLLRAVRFAWWVRWRASTQFAAALDLLDTDLWPAGEAAAALVAQYVVPLPNLFAVTPYSVVWILAAFAAISVTLLAVVFAVATFRGQQLAERLPPEVAADLFDPGWLRATVWRVVALVAVSLLGLAPVDTDTKPLIRQTINAVAIGCLLTAWLLVSMGRGVKEMFARNEPVAVARQVVRYLTDDYLLELRTLQGWPPSLASGVLTSRTEPFAIIEQICNRALRAGDLTTVHLVLRATVARVLEFEKENSGVGVARPLLGWLGELLSVIGRKALPVEQRTADWAVRLFDRAILTSIERRHPWDERIEMLEAFGELQRVAIRERATTVVRRGLLVLQRAFQSALATAPPEEKVWSLHIRDVVPAAPDYDAESRWDAIREEWLSDISRQAELIVQENLQDAAGAIQHTIREDQRAVMAALGLGPRQKRSLLGWLSWQSAAAVQLALDRGWGEAALEARLLSFLPHELEENGLSDMILPALQSWRPTLLEAATRGILSPFALNDFAAAGRGLARKAHDKEAEFVVETLGEIVTALDAHTSGKMRARRSEVIEAIGSIANFDQRADSSVKRMIAAQLAAFGQSVPPPS